MVSAPESLRMCPISRSVYIGLIWVMMAPSLTVAKKETTYWGQFGSMSATRSPFLTPLAAKEAAIFSTRACSRPNSKVVP
jgi:hypothetical protein